MFSSSVVAASQLPAMRRFITSPAVSRRVVDRFVAGESTEDAWKATRKLVDDGLLVTLDHLGEYTTERTQAEAIRDAYLTLLAGLTTQGLADRAEVSVKLTALGLDLDGALALDLVAAICAAAGAAGTTVTIDMEDHTRVDATLEMVAKLRTEHPWVGAVVQSALRRTEGDCRQLTGEGSRVRLVKGAYAEPASVAHQAKKDVDEAYLRCLRILLAGRGYPMLGTHDPKMITTAEESGRDPGTFEYQMLYGVRVSEQKRLTAAGRQMRVYVPYGRDWYGYFSRRLAERPANLGFLLRSLVAS